MAQATWNKPLLWLLHFDHTSTPANVSALLEFFSDRPWQLKVANWGGELPLHSAARCQRGKHAVAIVKLLLKTYGAGVMERDGDHGRLPLHLAALNQKGEPGASIVTLLLTAYPAGAMQKDNHGKLPADYGKDNAQLPGSCKAMLRAAAERKWTPSAAVDAQGKVALVCYNLCLASSLTLVFDFSHICFNDVLHG